MKKLFILICLAFPSFCFGQYERLRVNNVNSWYNQSGSIDYLLFEVKPKGIYTEIGMYFDFSTRGTTFLPNDSLEVEMLFKLPPEAEVIDMWLWIEDTIIVADVYDKWTASQIYEDIVDRRTDPAILYRYNYSGWDWMYYNYIDYTDYYMFKIFPMLTSLPRKAKITYLLKNPEGLTRNPSIALPKNILSLSNQNVLNTSIRFFPENGMVNPKLTEIPTAVFTHHTNPSIGNYYEAILTNASSYNSLTLNYQQQVQNSIMIGSYYDPYHSEKFYQLQIKPRDIFGISGDKKTLFMFDFIPAYCNSLNGTQLLAQVKSKIFSQFSYKDSVNFMFSGLITHSYNNSWLPCDSVTILNAFNSMNSSWFNSYSNLLTLLTDGIQFIKNHKDIGNIVLISSSSSNGTYQQANGVINSLINMMGTKIIPIHIIDLNEMNSPQYYINGLNFYGNEYLYVNLSSRTSGENFSIRDDNFSNMLTSVAGKLSGFFINFDMYTTLENGYTYSNFDLFAQSGLAYFDQPAQKIGKYNGSGRFRIIAHGQLPNGHLYTVDTLIDNNYIKPSDSVIRAMWAAQLIRELTSQNQTNSIIGQIINFSMYERVLSDYTAFLALEPGIGTLKPTENNGTTGFQQHTSEKLNSIMVFPNPIDNKGSISYSLEYNSHILIEIFDIIGKRMAVLLDIDQSAGEFTFDFDFKDFSPGVYICQLLINDHEPLTVKLIKK